MRHECDIDIAIQVFGRSKKYYHCPHFDKKGRMLAFCHCPVLPYYFYDIAQAWKVHCEMRKQLFSIRREYTQALQEAVSSRLRKYDNSLPQWATMAWPDILLFLEPQDICTAALEVMG